MDLSSVTPVQTMKVELNRTVLDSVTSTLGSTAEVTADNSLQAPEEDKATLHTDKASLEALAAQALNSPEIRQDKVDALRQAIKSGHYQIEPQAIAEGVIRESQ
ncbi:MAG: flagellar biosynthesis anti-sigma factor FlgM [Terriglobales bacterium]